MYLTRYPHSPLARVSLALPLERRAGWIESFAAHSAVCENPRAPRIRKLVAALQGVNLPQDLTPDAAAERLLDCLEHGSDGSTLDFKRLDAAHACLAWRLPAAVALAFLNIANESGWGTVCKVVMGDHIQGDSENAYKSLTGFLNALPDLTDLTVQCPKIDADEIFLAGLRHQSPPLIVVDGAFAVPTHVHPPRDAHVLVAAGTRSEHECIVTFADGTRRPIGGLIGRVRGHDGELRGGYVRCGPFEWNTEVQVKCRDLAMQRLRHRVEYIAHAPAGEYWIADRLRNRDVDPDTTLEYRDKYRAAASALFRRDAFGNALASLCRSASPAPTRHMGVDTGHHIITGELHAERGPGERGTHVRLWDEGFSPDANIHVTHTHQWVPFPQVALPHLALDSWFWDNRLDSYFEGAKFGAIYSWPADGEPVRPAARAPTDVSALLGPGRNIPALLKEFPREKGNLTFWAMSLGVTDMLVEILRGELIEPVPIDDARLNVLECLSPSRATDGLWCSLYFGRTQTTQAYVTSLLDTPLDVLSHEDREWLLAANLGSLFSFMPPAASLSNFIRLLATRPGLSEAGRLRLLKHGGMDGRRNWGPQTLLYAAASMTLPVEVLHPAPRSAHHELIYRCVREYVRAGYACPPAVTMSLEHIGKLCAADYEVDGVRSTAAKAAVAFDNPAAAAAMQTAIIEGEPDGERRKYLLDALGVTIRRVLSDLASSGRRADALCMLRLRKAAGLSGDVEPPWPPRRLGRAPSRTGQPSPVDRLCAELERMVKPHWIDPASPEMIGAELADAILDCVIETQVDFTKLDSVFHAYIVERLSPAAWMALDDHVFERTGRRIEDVALSDMANRLYRPENAEAKPIALLLQGLNVLKQLRRLSVPLPDRNSEDVIDLEGLLAAPDRPAPTVVVRGGGVGDSYRCKVPKDAKVEKTNHPDDLWPY
jgi:hypothetical protein